MEVYEAIKNHVVMEYLIAQKDIYIYCWTNKIYIAQPQFCFKNYIYMIGKEEYISKCFSGW